MKRRTLLKSVAALATAPALAGVDLLGQSATLSDAQVATLRAVAEVALPSALSAAERNAYVDRFAGWVHNYKEGADRGHGYGDSRLSAPTGASPATRYPAQFAALDDAARSRGGTSFAALARDQRRLVIEAVLSTPQPVNNLPARPTGANLVADFMGLYFNSPDATDLAYQRAIMRDNCRGLPGSEKEPERLK
jgi:hypothetical protein